MEVTMASRKDASPYISKSQTVLLDSVRARSSCVKKKKDRMPSILEAHRNEQAVGVAEQSET